MRLLSMQLKLVMVLSYCFWVLNKSFLYMTLHRSGVPDENKVWIFKCFYTDYIINPVNITNNLVGTSKSAHNVSVTHVLYTTHITNRVR